MESSKSILKILGEKYLTDFFFRHFSFTFSVSTLLLMVEHFPHKQNYYSSRITKNDFGCETTEQTVTVNVFFPDN
ncbi:CLUMA_CG018598, isoform A [Clunio marinus]|uniref:CLUMA_CG018598, isoform A n=1 Tax=Clunio marinus TaxID=568069 RepID=A0A1J1J000_9DIPT|nr:CLUMA_CG018598, isoform A [Clunio marinus]